MPQNVLYSKFKGLKIDSKKDPTKQVERRKYNNSFSAEKSKLLTPMHISKNNLRLFNRLHFVYATALSIQAPRGTGRNGNDGTAMLHASRQRLREING